MAASAACSNPHVFTHTLRFSARGFLALTKKSWFLAVPLKFNLLIKTQNSQKVLMLGLVLQPEYQGMLF